MPQHHSSQELVTFEDVEIGMESQSGLAVSVEIKGEHYWVPLSQVTEMHRDPRKHDSDRIVVTAWWAKKQGLL